MNLYDISINNQKKELVNIITNKRFGKDSGYAKEDDDRAGISSGSQQPCEVSQCLG